LLSGLLAAVREPESPNGRRLSLFVGVLIAVSMLGTVFETVPGLPAWLNRTLVGLEYFVVAVFTLEYLLRLAASRPAHRYVFSFFGVIDLLAILPFYLGLALDLRSIRALRLLRLFRILKLGRYGDAFDRLGAAFRTVSAELTVFFVAILILLYLCGVGIYYCENEAQPEVFRSVLSGFWWAIVSLTTVGYGDIYPITPLGKVFASVVLFIGLGVVAVPTGLIASALTRTSQSPRKQGCSD
jgi:voltage-gated potassium channel